MATHPHNDQHPSQSLHSMHQHTMAQPNAWETPSPSSALLVRPSEAARLLAISERSLWAFTQAGEIPCIRIGRSVRYCPADLAAWIASRKQEAIADPKAASATCV
jgi:excisionase family DNA binding protein